LLDSYCTPSNNFMNKTANVRSDGLPRRRTTSIALVKWSCSPAQLGHFSHLVRDWPIATDLAGLAEVSCHRQSRLDLLAASVTARDPLHRNACDYCALTAMLRAPGTVFRTSCKFSKLRHAPCASLLVYQICPSVFCP